MRLRSISVICVLVLRYLDALSARCRIWSYSELRSHGNTSKAERVASRPLKSKNVAQLDVCPMEPERRCFSNLMPTILSQEVRITLETKLGHPVTGGLTFGCISTACPFVAYNLPFCWTIACSLEARGKKVFPELETFHEKTYAISFQVRAMQYLSQAVLPHHGSI